MMSNDLVGNDAAKLVAEDKQRRVDLVTQGINALLREHSVQLLALATPTLTSDGTLKVTASFRIIAEDEAGRGR